VDQTRYCFRLRLSHKFRRRVLLREPDSNESFFARRLRDKSVAAKRPLRPRRRYMRQPRLEPAAVGRGAAATSARLVLRMDIDMAWVLLFACLQAAVPTTARLSPRRCPDSRNAALARLARRFVPVSGERLATPALQGRLARGDSRAAPPGPRRRPRPQHRHR
jgi:hypothetical protein